MNITPKELAWLSIVALCAFLLAFPFVAEKRERSQLSAFASRGRLIYQSLHASLHFETWEEHENQWRLAAANSSTHPTSTEFFRDMVSSQLLNVEFSIFGGMGIPAPSASHPSDFTASNNAWCIVSGHMTIHDERAPVLFTKNVDIDFIGPGVVPSLSEAPPFGRAKWITVTRGGAAFVVEGSAIPIWHLGSERHSVMRP